MKKHIYIVAALSAILMGSCTQDENILEENITGQNGDIIKVDVEPYNNDSRSVMNNDGTITWEIGDKIAVLVNTDQYNPEEKQWFMYEAISEGVLKADFMCPELPPLSIKDLAFYGIAGKRKDLYSYINDFCSWDEETSTFNFRIETGGAEIPFVKIARPNKRGDNFIKFMNPGALLMITVNNIPEDIPYQTFNVDARGDNEYCLSGPAQITFEDNETPVMSILPEDGYYSSEVFTEVEDPETREIRKTYYFTIPPGYYRQGLKLSFANGGGLSPYTLGYIKDATGGINILRNEIIPLTFDYHEYTETGNDDFASAIQNSNYIRLTEDVTLTEDLVLTKEGEEVIIELNNYSLYISEGTTLTNKADLKLRDGKVYINSSDNNIVNEGVMNIFDVEFATSIDENTEPGYGIYNKGTLTLGGQTTMGHSNCKAFINEGQMVITNGTYNFTRGMGEAYYSIINRNDGAKFELRGGIINGQDGAQGGIITQNGAKTIIYGGEVKAEGHAIALEGAASSVNIKDGYIKSIGGKDCIYNANTDIETWNDKRILIEGGYYSYTSYQGWGILKWELTSDNQHFVPVLNDMGD